VEDYAYDGEGNRTASHLSAVYSSNDHNQLLEDDTYTYAYDAKGNRVSRTAKGSGAIETYTYDSQNRLVGYGGSTTASYAYDAMDRRIAKTVNGAVTSYIYDTSMEDALAFDDILLEFDASASPILTRRWVHSDAVDEPLGFESYTSSSGVGSGTEHAMFADRQGSVIWVTQPATGTVVAGYEYDGYGQITQTGGTLQQPYGYTGREYDAESGLYHYRARAYDPAAGVFAQVDPIEFGSGQLGISAYVDSDPFNMNDPSGTTESKAAADLGTISAASGLRASTNIGVAAITAAGGISTILQNIVLGDFRAELKDGKFKMGGFGYCSPSQHASLQDEVNRWKTNACHIIPKGMGVEVTTRIRMENLAKMQNFSRLALARASINAACYQGGDAGHLIALSEAMAAVENCYIRIVGKN
jgi:RHS repeat-associated protein